MSPSKPPAPWLRGAKSRDEVDLLAFVPLAHKFAHRYESFLGSHDDAFQEAMIGLMAARDHFDPSRGPFEKIAAWYIQSHFSGLIEKEERRRGVPARLRKQGRHKVKRGRVYSLRPWQEVEVQLVSASQVGEGGEEMDLFDSIPSPAPNPEKAMLADESARVLSARVAAVVAGLRREDRKFVLSLLDDDLTPGAVSGRLHHGSRLDRLRHAFRALRP